MASKDRATAREAERRYREANLERVRATQRESKRRARLKDPDGTRAKARAHYAKNRERIRAAALARYEANPERDRQYSRNYRAKNRERANAVVREWRKQNPAKAKAVGRAWHVANMDKVHIHHKTRRALKAGAPINDFTADQWIALQIAFNHRCGYCNKRRKGRLTQDHVVPLSKGGAHTASNIVPACQSCNSTKHTGPPLRPIQMPLLVK